MPSSDLVTDIVEGGHKVLVFSQFVQMLHIIRSWLVINADVPVRLSRRFEQGPLRAGGQASTTTPEIPIFLISLKAGGTGHELDLGGLCHPL